MIPIETNFNLENKFALEWMCYTTPEVKWVAFVEIRYYNWYDDIELLPFYKGLLQQIKLWSPLK